METKAVFDSPRDSRTGVIMVFLNRDFFNRKNKDNNKSAVVRRIVACIHCTKSVISQNKELPDNSDNKYYIETLFIKPESTKEHIDYMNYRLYR